MSILLHFLSAVLFASYATTFIAFGFGIAKSKTDVYILLIPYALIIILMYSVLEWFIALPKDKTE